MCNINIIYKCVCVWSGEGWGMRACVCVCCWLLLHFVLEVRLYVMKWNGIDKCVCGHVSMCMLNFYFAPVLDVGPYFTLECYLHLFTILHSKTGNSTILLTDYLFTTLHHTTSISTIVLTVHLFTTLHHKSCIPTMVLTDHLCTAILQEQIKLVVEFILQEVGEVIRVNLAWE